ncbi:ATP-grasp domain-containing protein [Actinobacillus delphinicola]|uniref:D-alanine--D-alanine ligase n=1 Tax=Actinobacillus delphinicola TaxID=51161 RepID=A0A448TV83_9PAST|nr:ATP-grasp domain-containing protein [Actinobacillus delphinicola]VEJ09837.1 D-alanine--D-alanine ligase [Actinobacillus delphinicola]
MSSEYIGLIGGRSGDSVTDEIKKRGFKVALVCGKNNEPGHDIADKLLVLDYREREKIKDFFIKLQVKKIVISTGHILAFKLAKYLEDNKFIISINVETSLLCKDKFLLKEKMKELGFKTPEFLFFKFSDNLIKNQSYLKKILDTIDFPIVLKSNLDIIPPIAVHSKIELYKYYYKLIELKSDILVEELITGSDLTIPILFNGKKARAIDVFYYSKGKEDNLIGFDKSETYKINNEYEVKREAEKLIEKISVLGLSRADAIVNDSGIYFLEINSVILCGHTQESYTYKWKEKGYNFASLLVDNAFRIFNI